MNDVIKILLLHTRLADYFYQGLRHLVEKNNAEILVIVQPTDPDAPFEFDEIPNLHINNGVGMKTGELMKVSKGFQPDMLYVANWRDQRYRIVATRFKQRGKPVVLGMDNLWKGTLRQKVLTFFAKNLLHRFGTHLLVPGSPQFAFATRLGFEQPKVMSGLYCANTSKFEMARKKAGSTYPKKILFVGRFVPYKKPIELAQVFREIQNEINSDWSLHYIGRGPLEKELQQYVDDDLKIHDFVQPKLLPDTFVKHGVFCLPSNQEHWGVVVHEAAAAGMPLLLSDTVGAASEYLISGYNGYSFKTNALSDLKLQLQKIMTARDEEIMEMGERSSALAEKWNYERWAANFISVLK